jgi:hypothetical protein
MITLSSLLKETYDDRVGNIILGDKDDDPIFAKLQKAKLGSEPDTAFEKRLLKALDFWTRDPASQKWASDELDAIKKDIIELRSKFPKIFLPKTPNGTILYRGIKNISDNTITQLKKVKLDKSNWKKMYLDGEDYLYCNVPLEYIGRSPIQSWTNSKKKALEFTNDGLLTTKQDNDFFFNQAIFDALFHDNENEVLHFGHNYKGEIHIAVSEYTYRKKIK